MGWFTGAFVSTVSNASTTKIAAQLDNRTEKKNNKTTHMLENIHWTILLKLFIHKLFQTITRNQYFALKYLLKRLIKNTINLSCIQVSKMY